MDAAPPASPRQPLAEVAAAGFAWLFGQSVVLKVASVFGRIALAWWLTPADFGLVGLADTIVVVALLIQWYGLREQLVRLGPRMDEWMSAAFWLSVVTGLLGGGLVLLAAPWAVRFYGEPRLMGLLLLLGATSPLMTIHLVPLARLESDMRFRYLALVNIVSGCSATLLAVVCASMGLGAFSLIVPRPVVALGSAAALFWAVRPRLRWALEATRWPYLLGGGGLLLLASLASLVVSYGDYAIIGRLLGTEAVGLYYFAFGLSTQTWLLLTDNLARVLLPAFSALADQPIERRREAFVRSARLLALVGIPLCFLQAAIAAPLIRLLFGPRWSGAIPILQLLSVGMAGSLLTHPSRTLLKAQGRMGTLLGLSIAASVLFVALVTQAASTGALVAATAAVAFCLIAAGLAYVGVTLHAVGAGLRALGHVYAAPLVAGSAAVTTAWAIGLPLPDGRTFDVLRLVLTTAAAASLYALTLRLVFPTAWQDLRTEALRVVSAGATKR